MSLLQGSIPFALPTCLLSEMAVSIQVPDRGIHLLKAKLLNYISVELSCTCWGRLQCCLWSRTMLPGVSATKPRLHVDSAQASLEPIDIHCGAQVGRQEVQRGQEEQVWMQSSSGRYNLFNTHSCTHHSTSQVFEYPGHARHRSTCWDRTRNDTKWLPSWSNFYWGKHKRIKQKHI